MAISKVDTASKILTKLGELIVWSGTVTERSLSLHPTLNGLRVKELVSGPPNLSNSLIDKNTPPSRVTV